MQEDISGHEVVSYFVPHRSKSVQQEWVIYLYSCTLDAISGMGSSVIFPFWALTSPSYPRRSGLRMQPLYESGWPLLLWVAVYNTSPRRKIRMYSSVGGMAC